MTYDAAPRLKEQFDKAGFSPDQMNVVLEAMKASKSYHSMSQIQSLWELSCPDYIDFETKTIPKKDGGSFQIKTAIHKKIEVDQ